MAVISDVADVVVTVLNDASLGFTAERLYRPISELKEISTLKVTVVPRDQTLSLGSRGTGQRDLRIDIGIQKKLADADNAEIDELMGLVEEIFVLIRQTRAFGTARWMSTVNEPIYAPEHLSEWRVFTSVLTLTLRVVAT